MSCSSSEHLFINLSNRQTNKVLDLLGRKIIISPSKDLLPSINICVADFLYCLRNALFKIESFLLDPTICLNGSAASWVLSDEKYIQYNDIDVIFNLCLSQKEHQWALLKKTVAECILCLWTRDRPQSMVKNCIADTTIDITTIRQHYLTRSILVNKRCIDGKGDLWGLITLQNDYSHNLELKFVQYMKRTFQFSVDSFQIRLHADFLNYVVKSKVEGWKIDSDQIFRINVDGYEQRNINGFPVEKSHELSPSPLQAISVYGNIREALNHLNMHQIVTKFPEEIRGGGFLKYCELLVRGYRPRNAAQLRYQEKYMCTRFFIDFRNLDQQSKRLIDYLNSHFKFNEVNLRLMTSEQRTCVQIAFNISAHMFNQYVQNDILTANNEQMMVYFLNGNKFNNTEAIKAKSIRVFYH
ncbi:hypothetical protein GJ496_010131 [Pomphorhynchus laevis]|nr:hypothetical protein GJ496_010131 [Pomphorhynchus laevis]